MWNNDVIILVVLCLFVLSDNFQVMASGGFSSAAQGSLSCSVCFEKYDCSDHLPKALPCLHTFCSACIDGLVNDDDNIECPICRHKATSGEVRINLAVRDIIENFFVKQRTRLTCPEHPRKECHLICIDCFQPLCSVCVKGLMKGLHNGHNIDDVRDSEAEVKRRLTTLAKEKIALLEELAAVENSKLLQESEKYVQGVNTVVYMVSEALHAWRDEQLSCIMHQTQQSIDKKSKTYNSLKVSWTEKIKVVNIQDMMTSCRVLKESKVTGDILTDTFTGLSCQVKLDELQSMISSLINSIPSSITESNLHPGPSSSSSTPEGQAADGPCLLWDFIVHLYKWTADQHKSDSSTRTYMPQCVERVLNVYNRKRNTKFYYVVHVRDKTKHRLVCKTDDFVFSWDNKRENSIIDTLWSQDLESQEDIKLWEEWDDVSADPAYSEWLNY